MANRNTNPNPVEPVVMTFRLSPDVMEQALPFIKELSALQAQTDACGRNREHAAPADAPTYGEERLPKQEARAMLPEDHEGVSSTVDADERRPNRRGRIPGLYKLAEAHDVDVDALTPSALAIYRVMQARVRKAATATAIANRLHMSQGTVGWALAELRKVGVVEYVPRAGAKAAAPKGATH